MQQTKYCNNVNDVSIRKRKINKYKLMEQILLDMKHIIVPNMNVPL